MKICYFCEHRFDNINWQCPSCNSIPEIIENYLAFSPKLAQKNSGFKPNYFLELSKVEAQNFWFKSRNQLILWALSKYFPKATNFFEIGCGTGFVLSGIAHRFSNLKLLGSEIFSAGLHVAAQRVKGASLFQMDARAIPFEEEFDVMGAFDVLEHIEEDEVVLAQMHQSVRQGGGIILTVPQHMFLWSKQDEYACHVRRYNARELKSKVEQAGFKILKITSFVSLLLPLMMLSRMFKQNSKKEYDVLSEFKLPSPLNSVFEKVSSIERSLIRLGIKFPAGGSLFLIAQKI